MSGQSFHVIKMSGGMHLCSLVFFYHWKAIALNTKKRLQKIIPFKGSLCILFRVRTQSAKCSVTCTAITHLVRSHFRTPQLPIILAHFSLMYPTAVLKLQFSSRLLCWCLLIAPSCRHFFRFKHLEGPEISFVVYRSLV